jgi:hypothetical protein
MDQVRQATSRTAYIAMHGSELAARLIPVALLLAAAACATGGRGDEARPEDPFLVAIEAVRGHLHDRGWRSVEVAVDPRPLPADARGVGDEDSFIDAPTKLRQRATAIQNAGLNRGDLLEAQECAHTGGMGGLILDPLTPEQEARFRACIPVSSIITLGASLPQQDEASPRGVILRVVGMGRDAEMAWDVHVHPEEGVQVVQVMYHISSRRPDAAARSGPALPGP